MSYETRFFYFRRFSTTGSDTSCPDGSAFLPPCIVDSDASALRRRHSNGHHCVEDVFHHHWCCVLLFSFSVLSPHHSSAHSRLLSCTDFHTRSYYFHFRGRSTDAFAISCFICLFLFRLHWARALHRAVALFTLLLRCAVVAGPFYCEKVSSDPPKIKKGEKWSAGKKLKWIHFCMDTYGKRLFQCLLAHKSATQEQRNAITYPHEIWTWHGRIHCLFIDNSARFCTTKFDPDRLIKRIRRFYEYENTRRFIMALMDDSEGKRKNGFLSVRTSKRPILWPDPL